CSTQMGLDDLEGTLLLKELGADRVVLSREVPIEKVKEIKKIADIPIEIFVHGALCMSYSGNCLISGLTGFRSGNRGRCVGSCRKPYELIDTTTGESLGIHYLLSTKDLNTIDYIDELKDIDSLKIEGRMKEPVYVANVISKYRAALDGTLKEGEKDDLKKTFNRTFTKGYLFGEQPRDISNIKRPNNYGYEIGKVTGFYKGMYEIRLNEPLSQNDIVRIDHNNEDVVLSLVRLYDRDGNLVNRAEKTAYVKIKEKLSNGDIVYLTKDSQYYKELEASLDKEFKRFPLNMKVYAYPDSKLVIDAEGLGCQYIYESEDILSEAKSNPTTRDQVEKQLSKLGDTVFTLGEVEFEEYNAFIPVKMLNSARREIVEKIYDMKIASKGKATKKSEPKEKISFEQKDPYITASVSNKKQYDACVKAGIREIYFENIVRRNQNDYQDMEGELLIGGYGGVYRYRNTNPFVTDYSMNVVNSSSVHELHRLGAKRVTLSYEINKKQIRDLIDAYFEVNEGYPSLEMVVYGRAPMLFTKYCPLKKMKLCGLCKKHTYEIRDDLGVSSFPIMSHDDCTTTILNGKLLNLLDEIQGIDGVEAFRLNFTTETPEEVMRVCRLALGKLDGSIEETLFDQETDTRGHFNKEII
ncbi:MAG: U32 family peptidase, partial [Firmicutes bacterium]|nr:U32 family peptidase [Bacillota bacterium]